MEKMTRQKIVDVLEDSRRELRILKITSTSHRRRAQSKVFKASVEACGSVSKSRRKTIADMNSDQWIHNFDASEDDDAFQAEMEKRACASAKFLAETSNPFELHLFAIDWNWDDGVQSLPKLVKNDACDAGTALMLYWFTNPERYTTYQTIQDCPGDKRAEWKLSRCIERKFKRSEFGSRLIPFDPSPWVTDGYEQYAVRKIPQVMLDSIVPQQRRPRKKK